MFYRIERILSYRIGTMYDFNQSSLHNTQYPFIGIMEVMTPLTFSRYQLAAFLVCQRRFQLRYLQRLPWPSAPMDERTESAVFRGQQFHQLLQRHFLGLAVTADSIEDPDLQRWWVTFMRHNPVKKAGLLPGEHRFLPELTLTLPIGQGHLLTGRFDLLVIGEVAGEPFAHLFDWKTGKPQKTADLQQDWQTRLYLGMLAEGGGALLENGRSLSPHHLHLTYWYVQEPDTPRTLHYSLGQHQQNWAELQTLVGQIETQLAHQEWPLTNDLTHCRDCVYQMLCQRQAAGTTEKTVEELEETTQTQLEPELP